MKKLLSIIFILLLFTADSYAISLKEVEEKWKGKTVFIIQDIALTPSGIFCEIIDTIISQRDGDKYIVTFVYYSSSTVLHWINIDTVLKIKEWEKVVYKNIYSTGKRYSS